MYCLNMIYNINEANLYFQKGAWAQVVPDPTTAVTSALGPITDLVGLLGRVAADLLNIILSAINPNTVSSLISSIISGLTASLSDVFALLKVITDAAAGVIDALQCALNATNAILDAVNTSMYSLMVHSRARISFVHLFVCKIHLFRK